MALPETPWRWGRVPRSGGRRGRGRCRRSASGGCWGRRRWRRDACWSNAGTSAGGGCAGRTSAKCISKIYAMKKLIRFETGFNFKPTKTRIIWPSECSPIRNRPHASSLHKIYRLRDILCSISVNLSFFRDTPWLRDRQVFWLRPRAKP